MGDNTVKESTYLKPVSTEKVSGRTANVLDGSMKTTLTSHEKLNLKNRIV
jgi:hypothetical protein